MDSLHRIWLPLARIPWCCGVANTNPTTGLDLKLTTWLIYVNKFYLVRDIWERREGRGYKPYNKQGFNTEMLNIIIHSWCERVNLSISRASLRLVINLHDFYCWDFIQTNKNYSDFFWWLFDWGSPVDNNLFLNIFKTSVRGYFNNFHRSQVRIWMIGL